MFLKLIGGPLRQTSDEGNKHFASFELNGVTYSTSDFVYIASSNPSSPPQIAQLQAMWEDEKENKLGSFIRYFRPEETKEGRKPHHGQMQGNDEFILFAENQA
jgi:hypothetical protein